MSTPIPPPGSEPGTPDLGKSTPETPDLGKSDVGSADLSKPGASGSPIDSGPAGDGARTVFPDDVVLASVDLVAGYLPGVNILNGCHVQVGRGELVGIIGPNGAGKSTLIKTMFGLVPVRSGQVLLGDTDITGKPAHALVALGLGYVPQNDNVFSSLTIEENLEMGIYLRPKQFRERFRAVADLFPLLHDRRSQKCGSLSGGERQVVAMGRALMTEPEVLFLDEPSAGLSPIMQDNVFESVKQINDSGVSILMVEQNARRCLEICHRGYVLDQGRDAYTGTGEQLLDDPKVIELYLGTLARVDQ